MNLRDRPTESVRDGGWRSSRRLEAELSGSHALPLRTDPAARARAMRVRTDV